MKIVKFLNMDFDQILKERKAQKEYDDLFQTKGNMILINIPKLQDLLHQEVDLRFLGVVSEAIGVTMTG